MEHPDTDVNCATPDGQTPLDMVNSPKSIRILLMHGATPSFKLYEQYYPSYLRKGPANVSIKVFVLGYPGAGKSTLVKSLKTEEEGLSRLKNRFSKVKNVDEKTAGIIPHDINSKLLLSLIHI